MTLELTQEEAIGLLRSINIVPMSGIVDVKNVGTERIVIRTYGITKLDSFSEMDSLKIEYKVNRYTDKVKEYAVSLIGKTVDKIYLVKYSPNVINTLFNNIILLEMSNWRRAAKGLKPLKSIDDYISYKFEVNNRCSKRLIQLLKKIIEKNTYKTNIVKYKNTNEVIPADVWQNQLAELV